MPERRVFELSVSHSTCGLAQAEPDPVGARCRPALVCLAEPLEAATLVQTGRTVPAHAHSFSVVSFFEFFFFYRAALCLFEHSLGFI